MRGTSFALARAVLVVSWYLWMEALGVLAAGALWLARPWLGAERFERASFRLQCRWASALFGGARRLLGMRVETSGEEALGPGPILLLLRHASVADTLLPAALVSSRTGRRLRYVMKRELLWDPCLDVVGQRLPNAFVRRGTGDAAETARVRELARDLGPDEGVLLYPEGTRWTPARRRGPGFAGVAALAFALAPAPGPRGALLLAMAAAWGRGSAATCSGATTGAERIRAMQRCVTATAAASGA